jgi:hypothetical protein
VVEEALTMNLEANMSGREGRKVRVKRHLVVAKTKREERTYLGSFLSFLFAGLYALESDK